MKRLILPLMMCCFLFGCPSIDKKATAGEPVSTTWGASTLAPVPDARPVVVRVPADAPAELKAMKFRKGLTFRQRREMGITYRNIRRILLEKQNQGELEGKTSAVLAVEVCNQLIAENPQAFQDLGADWDWDAIMELVMKILEWVMTIIALFS